ncbi:MAG: FAD-binding oxidoreductase [Candidatus Devosia phytovorans]|uniref:FAD-binding oxidoreductase n=1 Tax=Candidatus Devosia phytovorans TaxID=3121372 RepID=A0AAJ5VUZ3_9HYPH|nr:FAD-binding oxidoreductase [Devosia sp.]WEK05368.1 MAG: FAD-binding oxidoreductase [Devosia sp.]
MNTETIHSFAAGHRGAILDGSHPDYEEARKLYNGMIDKRPLMIARCEDAGDVIEAVNFGRENKLSIAVRGGGHNGPGFGSVDDGLVIDLSMMRGVRVDPGTMTVRVGPGCTTGDVDHATHAFGQAVPFGIISTTGVAGLTLSGGHGYLSRQYGLTIDSLIEADVVLADGSFVTANETKNADLLWALRGGGGNFGVVTSFLFRTHPAKHVFGGPIVFDLSEAATVMRWYRQFQATAPRDFCIWLGLQTVPSGEPFAQQHWGKRMCILLIAHNGENAKAAVDAIRQQLPTPLFDWAGPMPYPALQSMFDALYPKGLQWYWKGDFVKSLPDAAIEEHIRQARAAPTDECLMHLYPIDGAVHDKGAEDTAWNCRDANWSMVIAAIATDPGKAGALKQWARGYWQGVHPFDLDGGYLNFMMDDEGEGRLRASYGENYPKLASLKAKFDPNNLFRVNQNVAPSH